MTTTPWKAALCISLLMLFAAAPAVPSNLETTHPDLDVAWISRAPVLDFVEDPVDPRKDGWPEPGSQVTWIAHVKNWGSSPLTSVHYEWFLDGSVVASGSIDLPAEGYASVSLPRTWMFQRANLTFTIDSDRKIDESEEQNNSLTVQTDALSVGFYVEQSFYDSYRAFFQEHASGYTNGCSSWEDWAQRIVGQANRMFGDAISPDAPRGVLDRWRIDEIVVVPDKSLPLGFGGQPTRSPNSNDRTVDLIWGFPASETSFYNPLLVPGATIHEMGHVRYLIDVYLFTIQDDRVVHLVNIEEQGRPVVGTPLMPLSRTNTVYKTFETGLMNTTYSSVDDYSAAALNQIAGYRARGLYGNTIFNPNVGIFIKRQLPAHHRIRLVDPDGRPLAGADVRFYRAERGGLVAGGPFGQQYIIRYNNTPDVELNADSNGEVTIDGDPFRKAGETSLLTGISILRVQMPGGEPSFIYLEVTAVNRAYWRGEIDTATYEMVVGASPRSHPIRLTGPADGATIWGKGPVELSWEKVPGATSYLVWASVDGQPAAPVAATTGTSLVYAPPGRTIEWFVEVQFNQCTPARSNPSRFALDVRKRAVVRPAGESVPPPR